MTSLTGSGRSPRGVGLDRASRLALATTLPLGRPRRVRDAAPAALPGRIGRFEVRGLLGEGAMGRVYRAYDPRGRREVAVKILKEPFASEPVAMARLRREAEALRRLSHPAFVAIHEVAHDHIVQDLVEGESLGARLRRAGRLAPAEALPILEAIAGALDHIHARGIVHRDVKPENVMLTSEGEVKITDFGLAHLAWAPLTGSHEMLGSPAYMAPEQITLGEVEPRSDLYALGVVAYEMLTGATPFRTATIGRLLEIIVREQAPAATATCPDLPRAVDPVLATALAKDPWDRFPSGRTFVEALRAALTRPSLVRRLWTSVAQYRGSAEAPARPAAARVVAASGAGSGRHGTGRARPLPG